MSTSTTGRVVRGADGTPWVGLTVTVTDVGFLFDNELARQKTGPDGRFTLAYGADRLVDVFSARRLGFEVLDAVGRRLARVELEDGALPVLNVPDIVVAAADGEGLPVTLGTGVPAFLSSGNAITLLIDNVAAWGHISKLFAGATTSIELMQLDFEIPATFNRDPAHEDPVLVFDFGSPAPTVGAPRPVNAPKDIRPERVLAIRARESHVEVRILLSQPVIELQFAQVVLTLLVFAPYLIPLVALIAGLLQMGGFKTAAERVRHYFALAAALTVKVRPAPTKPFAPTHAKLVIVNGVDGPEAVSVSSPLQQSYFGDEKHSIDDPRRGDNDGYPVHDVSAAVRGPAVADLHEAFRLHWNTHVPADKVAPLARPSPAAGGDGVATLQVVRTLIGGRFVDPADGEMGVLEAYLRAIATARHMIYLENQYFTNETIAGALLSALRDPERAGLQVVLLVNIAPDVPDYSTLQRRLIARMRDGLTAEQRGRFGVFTRWIHEPAGVAGRARIVPNYVHSKVGIVDDWWATIGSANLDGASLDFFQFMHEVQLGPPIRNSEVNLLILPDAGGPSPVVDLLRRKLWAEHLGFWTTPDRSTLNPGADELAGPLPKDWLKLWVDRAKLKLDLLKSNPNSVADAAILTWPAVHRPVNTPRRYLGALGVDRADVDVLGKTAKYDFKTGERKSAAKLDG